MTEPTYDFHAGLRLLAILLILLTLATAVVLPARGPGRRGTLRAQVTSWWWLMPVVFAAWAIHPLGGDLFVALIALLALHDLLGLAPASPGLRAALIATVGIELLALVLGRPLLGAALLGNLMIAGVAVASAAPRARQPALILVAAALQGAGLICLVARRGTANQPTMCAQWFLYVCVVTAINDIGQYLVGTSLGRHALAARLSPNKTWQGAIGGALLSIPVSVGVGRLLDLPSGIAALATLGLVLSAAGVCGDLAFSGCKRVLGIKDFGTLIPGHGGILDRVDSLVFTAPVLLLVKPLL